MFALWKGGRSVIRDKSSHHEKIIAAAWDEFLTYGFADASMRRIAAAAGMSAAGLTFWPFWTL
ncbi:MAG: TetR family transcriptional regulator [Eubacteriales bacterium]